MVTAKYPLIDMTHKPRVVFRSFIWKTGSSPRLANTKDVMAKEETSRITLYMPGGFSEKYNAQWKQEQISDTFNSDGTDGVMKGVLNDAIRAASELATQAAQGIVDAVKFNTGHAVFPGQYLCFMRTSPNEMGFSFDMIPRNKKEAEEIHKIIRNFKERILPEFRGGFLQYPDIWQLTFDGIAGPGFPDWDEHVYNHMALVGVDVSYNGGSQSALTFSDSYPVNVKLDLTFSGIKDSYLINKVRK